MKKYINKHWLTIILIGFGLTPVLWFWTRYGTTLINGVDTNFPLNPLSWFLRRFFVWIPINGGSDFSSSTAGLVFHLIQVIPFSLKLPLQIVEIFSLVFWFSVLVFSSFTLARTIFPQNKISQLVLVCIYVFNTYLFNTWENIKVSNIALVVGIPFLISIFIKLNRNELSKPKAILYTVISALLASGTGINPAYFVCLILPMFFVYVATMLSNLKRSEIIHTTKNFLLITTFTVLANAFWILPTANFILSIPSNNSILGIGFNNWVDSLSVNTNIFNVMRLQGAWDWYAIDGNTGQPLYIPYAVRYFTSLPFIAFSILIPGLSIFSIALFSYLKRKENLNLVVASIIMIILGVFLGAGTHKPTGAIFSWLSAHLPFFSLFRSPWYIFTPIVVVSYAILIGYLADLLKDIVSKRILNILAIALVIGNIVYCYPLVKGTIFRPGKSDTFYVNFPTYVFDATNWLNEDTSGGRVIGYPDDEIEQFNWGYRGIESILELGSSAEVLFSPLNLSQESTAVLIKDFYDALKKNQFSSVYNIARKLNISYLFNKTDQNSITFPFPSSIPLKITKTFGNWNFYDFKELYKPKKVDVVNKIYFTYPFENADQVAGLLPFDSHWINPRDSVVRSSNDIAASSGNVLIGSSSVSDKNVNQDLSKVYFNFSVPDSKVYRIIIESYKLEEFGIPTSGNFNLDIDNVNTNLKIENKGDYLYLEAKYFQEGEHVIKIDLKNINLVDFRGPIELETDGSIAGINTYKINNFDTLNQYLLRAKYQLLSSGVGEIKVEQHKGNALFKVEASDSKQYNGWNVFGVYLKPVKSLSDSKVSLIALPSTQNPQVRVAFDDLEVKRVFTNKLFLMSEPEKIALSSPNIEYTRISPVLYKGHVEAGSGSHIISFLENYHPNWKLKINNTRVIHFTLDSYANGWYVLGAPDSYDFEIYYEPQDIYRASLMISGVTVIASTLLFFIWKRRNSRSRQ